MFVECFRTFVKKDYKNDKALFYFQVLSIYCHDRILDWFNQLGSGPVGQFPGSKIVLSFIVIIERRDKK